MTDGHHSKVDTQRVGVKPDIAAFLKVLNEQITPALLAQGFKPTPINAREGLARLTEKFLTRRVEVAQVLDDVVMNPHGGYSVPVRLFVPCPEQAAPVLVYLHGGGGMCGSVTVYDGIYRRLAVATGHIVVAPEYRLAPENPYPAGQEDALTVLRHIRTVLDQRGVPYLDRIAVGGDSAGGALCSHLVQQALGEADLPIAAQVLVYPNVDFCMSQPSITAFGEGYLLTAERMRWYFAHYFQQGEDYCAMSSLFGRFSADMPPTLVITAGFDPLRDEGRLYADKLQAAGVPCVYHCFDELIHAYLNMEDLCADECAATYRLIADFLQAPGR